MKNLNIIDMNQNNKEKQEPDWFFGNYKKNKSTNFVISCDIFPYDVMVSVSQTNEELSKCLSNLGVEKDQYDSERGLEYKSFTSQGYALMFPSGSCILRIRKMPYDPKDYGILSHEIFHIATFILNDCGIESNQHTEEVHAYLIGYLTEKILTKLDHAKRNRHI